MSNILDSIAQYKHECVAECKQRVSENELLARVNRDTRGFITALQHKVQQQEIALIAELKKASPSKGLIREHFDPVEIAQAYSRAGATCLSILTDEHYFRGKNEYVTRVREVVELPILRKDFMLDTYQVVEARAIGADCILIIMAMIDDVLASELMQAAKSFNMDVLVEVHDRQELERALTLDCPLIGVNNRNLKTMEIDLNTSVELSQYIPDDRLIVCESGVETHTDIVRMQEAGIYSFLVGTSLMKHKNVEQATRRLLGNE